MTTKTKTADGNTQNCPYCGILFALNGVSHDYSFPKFGWRNPYATSDATAGWPASCKKQYRITSHHCPQCHQQVMWLTELMSGDTEGPTVLLFPKNPVKSVPPEVPPKFAADFREAHDTLGVSPKASAALSRRCLQMLIRDQEKITEKTLFAEVDKLIKLNKLPPALADELHAIREIGNFAAHPIKDTNTGQIVDVEPGEAQWTFDIVEKLLDFYFVEAARTKARREALNQKLVDAGKQPVMKT